MLQQALINDRGLAKLGATVNHAMADCLNGMTHGTFGKQGEDLAHEATWIPPGQGEVAGRNGVNI